MPVKAPKVRCFWCDEAPEGAPQVVVKDGLVKVGFTCEQGHESFWLFAKDSQDQCWRHQEAHDVKG